MTQNSINNTSSILAVDNLTLDGNTLSSTDTNGDVIIAPDGTGTVSVTAAPVVPSTDREDSLGSSTNSWDNLYADGLTFDDGSNIMSSYEVGTWTPTLAFGGGSTGITYANQVGNYTKIGNIVFIQCDISLTNKGSDAGNATLTLPITTGVGAGGNLNMQCAVWQWITGGIPFSVISIALQASSTSANINRCGEGQASYYGNLTNVNFANSSFIRFSGFYFV